MSTALVDTTQLSKSQKLAFMERLWDELRADFPLNAPPAWHQSILAARTAEWENRKQLSENWQQAKQSLRDEFHAH